MGGSLNAATTPDGVTLRYIDTGAGDPALVFVHGWTCSHTNWREQVQYFAAKHRVIAPDQRGHGESDKPDQDYTIEGFVDDIAWLFGELSLDRPVLIGHSMGGVIGLNLVRRDPAAVRGLVMIDSPVLPLPPSLAPVAAGMIAGFKSPTFRQAQEGFARTQFFNADTPSALAEELIASMASAPQRLVYTALESSLSPESMPAGEMPVPTLFLRAVTAYATEEQLRERYQGLDVRTINAAHFVQMERAEETNRAIEEFVRGIA